MGQLVIGSDSIDIPDYWLAHIDVIHKRCLVDGRVFTLEIVGGDLQRPFCCYRWHLSVGTLVAYRYSCTPKELDNLILDDQNFQDSVVDAAEAGVYSLHLSE